MRTFADSELIAALEENGISWQKFFALNGNLIAYENEHGRLMAKIIEDDNLSSAVCEFLIRHGKVRSS